MKILERHNTEQIIDILKELRQLNSLIWILQEILTEDGNMMSKKEVAEKLCFIYHKYSQLHKEMEMLLEGSIVV